MTTTSNRTHTGRTLLCIVASSALWLGCTKPAVRADPPAAEPPRVRATSAVAVSGAARAEVATWVAERQSQRAHRMVECAIAGRCGESEPMGAALEPALLSDVIGTDSPLGRIAAQTWLETEAARHGAPRWREIARLTVSDGDAPFLLVDLPRVLAGASPAVAARLLSAARPSLASHAAWVREVTSKQSAALEGSGLTRADLIAAQVGMDAPRLRALAERVLDISGPVLRGRFKSVTEVAADARSRRERVGAFTPAGLGAAGGGEAKGARAACALFHPDGPKVVTASSQPAPSALARACAKAAASMGDTELKDPLFALTVVEAARWGAEQASGGADLRVARALRLRRAAASVIAELDDADGDALDALATRWLRPGARAEAGAGALLLRDVSGADASALVAMLTAGALARWFEQELGPRWYAEVSGADVEATLRAVYGQWKDGGPSQVFAAVSASVLEPALYLVEPGR